MNIQHHCRVKHAQGFGIYGFGDVQGEPVLDECHGHFGITPGGNVSYHYHASAVTNLKGVPHRPYYMGCQGPSKSRCNTTVAWKYDYGVSASCVPTPSLTHSPTHSLTRSSTGELVRSGVWVRPMCATRHPQGVAEPLPERGRQDGRRGILAERVHCQPLLTGLTCLRVDQ